MAANKQVATKDNSKEEMSKRVLTCSRQKWIKWYTIVTNFILIIICVSLLADRMYKCFSR